MGMIFDFGLPEAEMTIREYLFPVTIGKSAKIAVRFSEIFII